MPRKPVSLQRWQLLGAFAAVTLSFVLGLYALGVSVDRTHELARKADRLALQLAAQGNATRKLRADQLAGLHQAAVVSCQSRHRIVGVLEGLLQRTIAEQRGTFPGLTQAQKKALKPARARTIASLSEALRDSRRADCTSVPPLPSTTHR